MPHVVVGVPWLLALPWLLGLLILYVLKAVIYVVGFTVVFVIVVAQMIRSRL